jgi:hypothetical protein
MAFRSEILVLSFGALLILVTFGDSHLSVEGGGIVVGNLDTIFGLALWKAIDVIYPATLITVFLLYGWTKGGGRVRFTLASLLVFTSFLAAIALISIDDIAFVLNIELELPTLYWNAVSWIFPVYSAIAFFIFGRTNQPKKQLTGTKLQPGNRAPSESANVAKVTR